MASTCRWPNTGPTLHSTQSAESKTKTETLVQRRRSGYSSGVDLQVVNAGLTLHRTARRAPLKRADLRKSATESATTMRYNSGAEVQVPDHLTRAD